MVFAARGMPNRGLRKTCGIPNVVFAARGMPNRGLRKTCGIDTSFPAPQTRGSIKSAHRAGTAGETCGKTDQEVDG